MESVAFPVSKRAPSSRPDPVDGTRPGHSPVGLRPDSAFLAYRVLLVTPTDTAGLQLLLPSGFLERLVQLVIYDQGAPHLGTVSEEKGRLS